MSDKARGGLFNILGDIGGLRVLDAFAGSGALAFEAVSRGAGHAIAIDDDRAAQRVITANIKTLGIDKDVRLISATANAWNNTAAPTTFDIVLCDPPYDDLQVNVIRELAEDRVAAGGLLVLSWPGSQDIPTFDGFEQAAHRSYGDMQLAFYRKLQ
jgi:16S rRNA (guanine966-N2)-methyltransferase